VAKCSAIVLINIAMTQFEFLPNFPLSANALALFGALLLAGAFGGELARRLLNIPRITGYVLVGLTLGASGLNVLDPKMLAYAKIFFDIGLGLILFELGRRLDISWLRRDRWLLVMAIAESSLSFGCMFVALLWFDIQPLYAAVAAAIGVSSSPAIVMLVAQELRAEGQVTERALNLVAINSVVAFFLVTMLTSWVHREYQAGTIVMLLHPLYLLIGSLFAGFVASTVVLGLARWFGKQAQFHIVLLLAGVVLLVGSVEALKLSMLIALLTYGVLVRNLDRDHVLMPVDIGRFGQIFYIVLFVTTGAMLQVADLMAGGAIAVIYVAARFVGKSIGILSFAHFSGVRAGSGGLLSIALVPMSGVALAMTYSATRLYPSFGAQLATIVLAAALILELVGPLAVQFALKQAGEAQRES
jgi:Kef-type K+ transport system membrane component KefB